KKSISPAIVRESFVGFCHAVNIFLFLDRRTATVGGIEQLVRELIDHSFFATSATVTDQPANRERGATIWIHFDRHLVVRTTYTGSLYFEQRLAVLDCLLEELQGFVPALLLEVLHRLVEDQLSGTLLALVHHRVHELRNQGRTVDRIGGGFA